MILKRGDDHRLIGSVTTGAHGTPDTYHVSVISRTDVEHLDRTIRALQGRQPPVYISITIVESVLGDAVADYLQRKDFYQCSKGCRHFVYKEVSSLLDRLSKSIGLPTLCPTGLTGLANHSADRSSTEQQLTIKDI